MKSECHREKPYTRIIYVHPDEYERLGGILDNITHRDIEFYTRKINEELIVVSARLKKQEILVIKLSVKIIKIEKPARLSRSNRKV